LAQEGIIFKRGQIEVPKDNALRYTIVKSRHNIKMVVHPGRAKTLGLVKRCFIWPSAKRFINQYVDGCDSCQRSKPLTLKPWGTLESLPIPAGPLTDISYDMITNLPTSKGCNSILTVINHLTKMAHFLPCKKSMDANQLADVMMRHVWKFQGTPKTIVSDRGSIFVSQIAQELNKFLGIQLKPLTAFHPRTDGQSELANKVVEQYLRHYVGYH
jgi:hypothetical protein